MIKFEKIHTVSNYISFLRIILVIPIIYFLSNTEHNEYYRIYAAVLMLLAAATDHLDGYLARKFDQVSELGKIIDPLADKIAVGLITIYLFLLSEIPAYLFFIILGRDVLIFLGGSIISNKVGKVLPSNLLGKITVFIIGIYLLAVTLGLNNTTWLNRILVGAVIIMSILSLIGYLIRAVEFIRYKKNETL